MKKLLQLNLVGLTCLLALLSLFSSHPHPAGAATFTIADGDVGGLKNALAAANSNDEADTIDLATDGTYTLTTVHNSTNGPNGLPIITNDLSHAGIDLTLNGHGASIERSSEGLTPDFRLLQIGPGATVSIRDLSLVGGIAGGRDPSGGGIYNDHAALTLTDCTLSDNWADWGGAIYNTGYEDGSATLALTGCTLGGNVASYGGGIFNDGEYFGSATVTLSNCFLICNWSAVVGGGIYNDSIDVGNATLGLTNCAVIGNSSDWGGGVYNDGYSDGNATLSLVNSTLSGNLADSSGGGVYNDATDGTATANLTNCTLSDNSAAVDFGGGIVNDGSDSGSATLHLANCTLSDNAAPIGGGIHNLGSGSNAATVQLVNTILQTGISGEHLSNDSGTITSLGYNLSNDDGSGFLIGTGDQINTDPRLDPNGLQDNGGPTETIALQSDSPAINAGDDATAPPSDQRHFVRLDHSDIGAYEFGGVPGFTINNVTVAEGDSGTTDAVFTVTLAAAMGGTVTVDYSTADGTATAPGDYTAQSGTLTFDPGETEQTITIEVNGDTIRELDETLTVALSNPNGTVLGMPNVGTLIIIEDDNIAPVNGSANPDSGTTAADAAYTITTTQSDGNGVSDIKTAYLLINSTVRGNDGLWCYYFNGNNRLYLRNDAGTAWLGGFAPGSSNVISNSQGSLDCANTTISKNGNTLTIGWRLSRKSAFGGTKNLYLHVTDKVGAKDGWDNAGTWTVGNVAPVNGSADPDSGTSAADAPYPLVTTYSDANGAGDIAMAYLLINTTVNGAKGMWCYYHAPTNKIYLRNDGGTGWLGGYAPESNNIISNSQGSIDCNDTSVSKIGNGLEIQWGLSRKSTFGGTKNLYLHVTDQGGAKDGWDAVGTWTLSDGGPTLTARATASPTPSLSTASANAATQSLQLTFSGSLDAGRAIDAARYAVAVKSTPLVVESAAYSAATNTVTLQLAAGSLTAGEQVVTSWSNLLDAKGSTFSGQTQPLAVK